MTHAEIARITGLEFCGQDCECGQDNQLWYTTDKTPDEWLCCNSWPTVDVERLIRERLCNFYQPCQFCGSAALDRHDPASANYGTLDHAWTCGTYWAYKMDPEQSPVCEILAGRKRTLPSAEIAIEELRAAGFDAWDAIPDPEQFIRELRG